jgi:flagellar basal body-associated protein FliL
MPEPEKPTKERAKAEEPPQRARMFSGKGLIILIGALVLEAVAGGILISTMAHGQTKPAQKAVESKFPRKPREYVPLDGPNFQVQEAPGAFRTVVISKIQVEVDAGLDEKSLQNLKDNITSLGFEIKDALKSIIIADGYQKLLTTTGTQQLQNKLRKEIIRLLGDGVTENDVKAVIFDGIQFGV